MEVVKQDIKSMTLEELSDAMIRLGEKRFRAKQIYQWLHQKLVSSFDEMTNLSVSFRAMLKENFKLTALVPIEENISALDGTRK